MNFSFPSLLSAPELTDGLMIFLGIVVEAFPFVVLGVLVSGIIRRYMQPKKLMAILPKHPLLACFTGSGMGFFFPVCECGNIPVARRLIAQGAPLHVVVTFLLSAPVFNPIVIVSTAVAFRTLPIMVLLRVLISVGIAVIVGVMFSRVKRPDEWTQLQRIQKEDEENMTCLHQADDVDRFFSRAIGEFFEMMRYLIGGAFIAAGIQVLVPRQILLGLGRGTVSSILSMMVLGFVVSICSTVDAFFAVSYSGQFSPLALLAFLIFGPMVDIKALMMMKTLFITRTIALISVFVAVLSFLSVYLLHFFMTLSL